MKNKQTRRFKPGKFYLVNQGVTGTYKTLIVILDNENGKDVTGKTIWSPKEKNIKFITKQNARKKIREEISTLKKMILDSEIVGFLEIQQFKIKIEEMKKFRREYLYRKRKKDPGV